MRETLAPRPGTGRFKEARGKARAPRPDAGARHTHRIEVQTGPQPVFVTIGDDPARRPAGAGEPEPTASLPAGHAPVPGGFAKLFNRVIDAGAWARLPEAGRACYVPLVRFADGREGFRVRIGLAALMRHTGLSRSSVKRGLRALLEARLLAVVRAGGVGPDGANRTNVYQLLLPEPDNSEAATDAGVSTPHPKSAARAKRGARGAARVQSADAARASARAPETPLTTPSPQVIPFLMRLDSFGQPDDPARGSAPDPLPVPPQTPRRPGAGPRGATRAEPPAGHWPDPAAGSACAVVGAAGGPAFRSSLSPVNQDHQQSPAAAEHADAGDELPESADDVPANPPDVQAQLVEMLAEWGVRAAIARDLAGAHSAARIGAALSAARQARAQGRLRNPAGFIVRCLAEDWAPPVPATNPAADVEASAQARQRSERLEEAARAQAARAAADAAIDALDEPTLSRLAAQVLARHADRPAMLRLLTARPPRASRLMRAEIAALLGDATDPA